MGHPPGVDLDHERRLHALLAEGVAAGCIVTAHDVSDGGLAVALAECAITGPEPMGAEAVLADPLSPDALLFGESTGRVIVAGRDAGAVRALAQGHGIAACEIGSTGGDRLVIQSDGGILEIRHRLLVILYKMHHLFLQLMLLKKNQQKQLNAQHQF